MAAIAAVSAATMASAAVAIGCTTRMDCSLGGQCVGGQCHCFAMWKGPNCSELAVLPSTNVRAWDRPGNQSSWGGSVVEDGGSQAPLLFISFRSNVSQQVVVD